MKIHVIKVVLLASSVWACSSTPNIVNAMDQDKPILAMSPSDIFSDSALAKLAAAAQNGDVSTIDELLKHGVNVNGTGQYGITPLYSAVQSGNKTGFKALLERGANPNVIWTNGDTLLNVIAESSPDSYFMQLALEHGGNPNLIEPRTGQTPLMAAMTETGKVNVRALIERGANLNQQTAMDKRDALMEAIADKQFDVAYELFQAGADYTLQDTQGWDVRDYLQLTYSGLTPPDQEAWRNKVRAYLASKKFLDRLAWPHGFRSDFYSLEPGKTYTLVWKAVEGASSYELRLNSKTIETGIVGTTIQKITPDKAHTEDGSVTWNVRACVGEVCSGWSPFVSITVK